MGTSFISLVDNLSNIPSNNNRFHYRRNVISHILNIFLFLLTKNTKLFGFPILRLWELLTLQVIIMVYYSVVLIKFVNEKSVFFSSFPYLANKPQQKCEDTRVVFRHKRKKNQINTNRLTKICKAVHRKLKIEKHELCQKPRFCQLRSFRRVRFCSTSGIFTYNGRTKISQMIHR